MTGRLGARVDVRRGQRAHTGALLYVFLLMLDNFVWLRWIFKCLVDLKKQKILLLSLPIWKLVGIPNFATIQKVVLVKISFLLYIILQMISEAAWPGSSEHRFLCDFALGKEDLGSFYSPSLPNKIVATQSPSACQPCRAAVHQRYGQAISFTFPAR